MTKSTCAGMDKVVPGSGFRVVVDKNRCDGNFITVAFEVELGQADEVHVLVREIEAALRMT